jgi:SEC-C motif-containing protein
VRDLCSCGSGRPFARCHGDPRNPFARKQALLEARQLATLFPSVRLTSPRILDFASRAAAELADEDELSEELLDEGARLVGESEVDALVRGWVDAYPDRWASLLHTAADERAARAAVVRGAIEVAVCEHGTTPRAVLAKLEAEPLPPGAALAFVLPPFFIWSFVEAQAALAAVAGRRHELEDPLRPVEEVAYALINVEHERRVRRFAACVEAELPVTDFPSASDHLDQACREARSDVRFVRAVASLILAAYVEHLAPASFAVPSN